MTQPKRYRLNPVLVWLPGADIVGIDNIREVTHASMECKEDESGMWVLHSDYAALSAENKRLKAKLSMSEAIAEICSQPPGEGAITVKASLSTGKTVLPDIFKVDELKAENERLRNAGDAMFNCAVQDSTGLWLLKPFQYWEKFVKGAAK